MAESTIPADGAKAPAFTLPDKDGKKISLKDFLGSWVVLYFYPKDNTSGCTLEAVDFSAANETLAKMGAKVLAVSPDSPQSHCRFADAHGLTITLLSDQDRAVLAKYGAWGKKKLYGKESTGVIRSTFLIGPDGRVRRSWTKVKVPGHVDAVKEALASLRQG